jgi:pSer/pThr/pTyr-binding forkhead associated (FHA) protein
MSDPFRDDREAQLARADALSVENERLKAERDALKEKLAAQGVPAQGVPTSSIVMEAPASTKTQITFYVRVDARRGIAARRVVTLDGLVVKIGRVASAHLRFDDPSVARMHAVIEARTAAEAFIFDLGTPSGTFVNGQRISRMTIKSGDVIKIGEVEMEILILEKR